MKFSSTKNLLILSAVLAFALVVGNYFMFSSIKNSNKKASELSQQVGIYEQKRSSFSGANGVSDIRSLIEKIASYFLGKDDAVLFIERVEKEARDGGVALTIRSVGTENFGKTDEKSKVDPTKELVRLKLEAKGTWRHTIRFISFIEHLPYKVVLEDVNFTRMVEGESSPKAKALASPLWRATIELTVLKNK